MREVVSPGRGGFLSPGPDCILCAVMLLPESAILKHVFHSHMITTGRGNVYLQVVRSSSSVVRLVITGHGVTPRHGRAKVAHAGPADPAPQVARNGVSFLARGHARDGTAAFTAARPVTLATIRPPLSLSLARARPAVPVPAQLLARRATRSDTLQTESIQDSLTSLRRSRRTVCAAQRTRRDLVVVFVLHRRGLFVR